MRGNNCYNIKNGEIYKNKIATFLWQNRTKQNNFKKTSDIRSKMRRTFINPNLTSKRKKEMIKHFQI